MDKNYKPLHKEFDADFNTEKEEILGIIKELQRDESREVDRKRMEVGGIGMGRRRLRRMGRLIRK